MRFFSRKPEDEPLEDQMREFSRLAGPARSYYMETMGEACDVMEGARGEFGRAVANPIPVNGPPGEIKYLSRLRCSCGCGLMFHRLGSLGVAGIRGNVDIYECVCLDANHWDVLYLHPYHPRRSLTTPDGYALAPFHRVFSKLIMGCGDNSFCERFPFGLPDLIRSKYDPIVASPVTGIVEKAISTGSRFQPPAEHAARVAAIVSARAGITQAPLSMERPDLARIEADMREGLFARALSRLSDLPEQDRSHWNICYLTGQCHRFLEHYADAETYLTKALAANPSEPSILLALGIAVQLQGKLSEAIAVLALATKLGPDYAEAYNSLALSQKKSGQLDEAVRNYDAGLKALARRIVKGMSNSPDSRILKHVDTLGHQWVEYAAYGATYLASADSISRVAWPSSDMAMREERSEAHKGLYYIDTETGEGKSTRLFLPNYFNTFRETLRADILYANLIGNRGSALEAIGRIEDALVSYKEAEEFRVRGSL